MKNGSAPKFSPHRKSLIYMDLQRGRKKGSEPRHRGLGAQTIRTKLAWHGCGLFRTQANEQPESLTCALAAQSQKGQVQHFCSAVGDALLCLLSRQSIAAQLAAARS
jgi:hypothetical protein